MLKDLAIQKERTMKKLKMTSKKVCKAKLSLTSELVLGGSRGRYNICALKVESRDNAVSVKIGKVDAQQKHFFELFMHRNFIKGRDVGG